ncbi:MAG: hypothetical protein DMG57_03095 [Acidobacteria bacterium]|nr:MAG: hypothetical protein DMG57_03095 [Acidobacteriota bacterium]
MASAEDGASRSPCIPAFSTNEANAGPIANESGRGPPDESKALKGTSTGLPTCTMTSETGGICGGWPEGGDFVIQTLLK